MTNENQDQTEPIKMYRPWVGVLLSLFLSGASQFLAGEKLNGIAWFLALLLLSVGFDWCLASPGVPGIFPALAICIISIVLWIVMLVKSYRPVPRLRWFDWICFILLFLSLSDPFVLEQKNVVRTFKMPTASMSPTIQRGDHIVAAGYVYWFSKPQPGDIVVFKTDGISSTLPQNEIFIKRVGGGPGDVLSIQNGHLYNHGQILSQPSTLAKLDFSNQTGQTESFSMIPMTNYLVPSGSYFVIGDNTTNSFDSRFFGAIPEKNIIGKVSKIYWPLNRVGNIQ